MHPGEPASTGLGTLLKGGEQAESWEGDKRGVGEERAIEIQL